MTMPRPTLALGLGFAAVVTVAASAIASELQDWAFVRSVGGLRVGTPRRLADGHVALPLDADVSGLREYSEKPTTMNSGLVCVSWRLQVETDQVRLTLETAAAQIEGENSRCPPQVDLGPITPMAYHVLYADPYGDTHAIATIHVK